MGEKENIGFSSRLPILISQICIDIGHRIDPLQDYSKYISQFLLKSLYIVHVQYDKKIQGH